MKTSRTSAVLVVLLFSVALCQCVFGSPVWTCSITSAVQCDEDGTIGPPELGDREIPTFLRVDADKKEVTLLAPESRRGEVTKIGAIHEDTDKNHWVFSGVEEGRSWSMVISAKGNVTISVTVDGATWSVFGNAMLETEDKE